MKKALSILAALCLLLAGCAPASSSQTVSAIPSETVSSEPEPVVWGRPDTLLITNPNFFGGKQSDYRARWEAYMAAQGYSLSVSAPELSGQEYLDYLMNGQGITGLVYIPDHETFLKLAAAGRIVPVGAYLADNKIFGSIPEEFVSAYSIGASVYGIPADGSYSLPWMTYYLESYDAALGEYENACDPTLDAAVTEPSSVPEVSSAGASSAASPSVSGAESSRQSGSGRSYCSPVSAEVLISALAAAVRNGTGGLYSVKTSALGWIFESYGAPLSSYGGNIRYDADRAEVVDSMLLDGAKKALLELRRLYSDGALNKDFMSADYKSLAKAVSSGKAGVAVCTARPAPKGYIESYVFTATQYLTVSGGCYCLMAGSAQGGESVNLLTELLWGSKDSTRVMSLGTEGYTVGEDGQIITAYVSDTDRTPVPSPSLCGCLPGMLELSERVRVYSDTKDTAVSSAVASAQYYDELYSDGLAEGMFRTVDYRLSGIRSAVYAANGAAMETAFDKLITAAATDSSITVEQALADYRAEMAELGGDEMLSEANSALGLTSTQSYK